MRKEMAVIPECLFGKFVEISSSETYQGRLAERSGTFILVSEAIRVENDFKDWEKTKKIFIGELWIREDSIYAIQPIEENSTGHTPVKKVKESKALRNRKKMKFKVFNHGSISM